MRFSLIDLSKLAIYGLFFNWYVVPMYRGSSFSGISLILYGVAAVGFLLDILTSNNGKWRASREEFWWLLYGLFSLATAVFALSTSYAVSSLVDYVKRLFLIICTVYICKKEKSIRFPVTLLTLLAVVGAVGTLTHLNGLRRRLDLTTEASLSVNDIASIMAYGVAAAGLFWQGKKVNFLVEIGTVVAADIILIVTIFLTGSRKAIFAVVIMAALLLLLRSGRFSKSIDSTRAVTFAVVLAVAAFVVVEYLLPLVEDTSLYIRLFGEKAEEAQVSDEGRWRLYELAFQDFLKHPITGLGYNNYDYLHHVYTHSTYVDPLACSGIISVFYLGPYVMLLTKQIRLCKDQQLSEEERMLQKRLLAFLVAFLFIGVGIPYIYKDAPCIILAMFVGSQYLIYQQIEERRNEHERPSDPCPADHC